MHQLIIVLMSIALTAVMITVTAVYTPASKTTTEINYALVKEGVRTMERAYQLYTKANNGATPAVVAQSGDGGLSSSFSDFLPFIPKAPSGYQWAYGYNATASLNYFCLYSENKEAARAATLTAFTRAQKVFSDAQYVLHKGGASNCGSTAQLDVSKNPEDIAITYFVRNVEGFSPKSLPGLVLWLDADDAGAVAHTNGAVSGWLDKSGYGNNALQANAGYMPTYNSTAFRGKGGLSFSRAGFNYLEVPLSQSLRTGAVNIYVAGSIDASGSRSTLVSSNTASTCSADCITYALRQEDQGGGAPVDSGIQFSIGNAGVTTSIEPSYAATAVNASALWEGAYSAGSIGVSQDLISATAGTATAMQLPSNNLQIGRGASAVQAQYLEGVLGEVVIYNRPLTGSERLRLQHYFGRKWALRNLVD